MPWVKDNPNLTNNPLYLEPRITEIDVKLAEKVKVVSIEEFKQHIPLYNTLTRDNWDWVLAIQAAIDFMENRGGGTVLIPKGVHLLKTLQSAEMPTFLYVRSKVRVIGEDENESILKIADNMNSDAHVFYKQSMVADNIDGARFKNFVIDFNGQNNIVPQDNPYRMHIGIGVTHGKNIVIENVTYKNNPGQQCISLGSNASPHTIHNAKVIRCKFENVGKSVEGNIYQVDHSCIYIQADGGEVTANEFENDTFNEAATAIECHSSNMITSGNRILNFATGINVGATVTDQKNTRYVNNIVNNCRLGFHGWLNDGFIMDNIVIETNQIVQSDSLAPIFDFNTDIKTPINTLTIRNNDIECNDTDLTRIYGFGISLGKVKLGIIKGNTFKNLLSRVFNLGQINAEETYLYLEENKIFDCGKTTNTVDFNTYKDAFVFFGLNKLKKLVLKNNEIMSSSTQYANKGVNGNAPVQHLEIVGNSFDNLLSNDMYWDVSVSVDYARIKHVGKGTPNEVMRADVDSEWIDKETKRKYVKRFGSDAYGWRVKGYGIEPPTSGTWQNGDEWENISPSSGGYRKWVHTGAAWKGYGLIQA